MPNGNDQGPPDGISLSNGVARRVSLNETLPVKFWSDKYPLSRQVQATRFDLLGRKNYTPLALLEITSYW